MGVLTCQGVGDWEVADVGWRRDVTRIGANMSRLGIIVTLLVAGDAFQIYAFLG
jgi:hypothetical protein